MTAMSAFFTVGLSRAFGNKLVPFKKCAALDLLPCNLYAQASLCIFLTKEQHEILLAGAEETIYALVHFVDSVPKDGEQWALFDRLSLTLEQVTLLPSLLLYILTAGEYGTHGEREHVQLLIALLLNDSRDGGAPTQPARRFLELSARLAASPPSLFDDQVWVQTVLALITRRTTLGWTADVKLGTTRMVHEFYNTMDYSFPQKEMCAAVHGGSESQVVAAYLLAYAGAALAVSLMDKFGLGYKVQQRAALNTFLNEATQVFTAVRMAPLSREQKKRKLDEAFEACEDVCERVLKQARGEESA